MEVQRIKCIRCKMNMTVDKFNKKRDDSYMKTCKECLEKGAIYRTNNKCEHGKQRYQCKQCGGSSICEHKKRRSVCKQCGGSSFCEHKRIRNLCKECGGASICEHERIRSKCKECGGASICEHERIRSKCKECGGSSICEHKKIRNYCIDCGGASICEHKKQRSNCRLCCKDVIKLTIKNMIKHSKDSDKKNNRYDPINLIDECFLKNIIEDYTHCYYEDCKVELQYLEYNDTLGTIERLDNSIGHIKSNCVICCLKCNKMRKSYKTSS